MSFISGSNLIIKSHERDSSEKSFQEEFPMNFFPVTKNSGKVQSCTFIPALHLALHGLSCRPLSQDALSSHGLYPHVVCLGPGYQHVSGTGCPVPCSVWKEMYPPGVGEEITQHCLITSTEKSMLKRQPLEEVTRFDQKFFVI